MAAAMTITGDPQVGKAQTIAGTGFASNGDIVVSITSREDSLEATWTVTADVNGDWAFPGSIMPIYAGTFNVRATDGTSTVSKVVRFFTK